MKKSSRRPSVLLVRAGKLNIGFGPFLSFQGLGMVITLNCSAVALFVSLCSHILGSNTRLLETNMGRVELKIFPKIPELKTYENVFFKPFE